MPELPEVETARRIVQDELTGRSVTGSTVRLPKLLRFSPIPTLELLVGATIVSARRRAKLLIVDFDNELSLVIHFKLAGQLAVHKPDGSRFTAGHPVPSPDGLFPHKSTHIELLLDDGAIVFLSDLRQFGWLRLLRTVEVEQLIDSFAFGPEATGVNAFQCEQLATAFARRSVPVKTVLLDQKVIAGLGNIYADESLFRAKLHPNRPANDLSLQEIARLCEAIPWVLERGIEQGGARIVHNKAYPVDGFPAVHGRFGEPCNVCGTTIEKTRTGARSTYFCPICQSG